MAGELCVVTEWNTILRFATQLDVCVAVRRKEGCLLVSYWSLASSRRPVSPCGAPEALDHN